MMSALRLSRRRRRPWPPSTGCRDEPVEDHLVAKEVLVVVDGDLWDLCVEDDEHLPWMPTCRPELKVVVFGQSCPQAPQPSASPWADPRPRHDDGRGRQRARLPTRKRSAWPHVRPAAAPCMRRPPCRVTRRAPGCVPATRPARSRSPSVTTRAFGAGAAAEPDVLHGVARHQVLVHAAREVALAQRAARDVLVALGLQAGEELVPQRRAGPVVVERERAALGRLVLEARGAEVHSLRCSLLYYVVDCRRSDAAME